MKRNSPNSSIDVQQTLSLMPDWVKEKARRHRQQKRLAEKVFGSVVLFIEKQQEAK
jgi:hypothetical protein